LHLGSFSSIAVSKYSLEFSLVFGHGRLMSDEPELFDLQPHLVGELIEVRPLASDDWEELFAVASDPLIWEQHPARDRYREDVFREFFREALETGSAFVVIERKTGKTIGSSRYFGLDPEESVVEIGWTFLALAFWGGEYNRELKRLMLDHAFKFVERVVFIIGVTNFRSQKALEKIGGVRVGRREKADAQGNVVENFVYEIRRNGDGA
jgi:N-acetyltransferase